MNSVTVTIPQSAKSGTEKSPPGLNPSIAISTMGCKVNVFESELVMQKLEARKYSRVAQVEHADVYLINTCTVTAEADRQARQQVRRAIRCNPDAWVIVTGCYAQIDPQACADIPGVDLVVGNSRKLDIPALLEPLYSGQLPPVMVNDIDREISLPDQLVSGFDGRTRAFVQIQQGCDQGCTFCIIHTARGPNRSFSPILIKRQVERLVINGYREIVICGVDIGSYGSDFEKEFDLSDLLAELDCLQGDFRLRLSSMDPAHISDRFIRLMSVSNRICPQLHLSMQSGCTLILKRMKRRATKELLYDRIRALREALPELVLSADILAGFPTETEQQFAETMQALIDLEICFPHVFSYSSRPGTPAAKIPRQVPVAERKSRARRARETGRVVWQQVAKRLIGTTQKVLVEGDSSDQTGSLTARASNYFTVKLEPTEKPVVGWQNVEITGVGTDSLFARKPG